MQNDTLTALPENPPDPKLDHRLRSVPKNTSFQSLLELKKKYPNISQRHLGKLVGLSKTAICLMFQRNGVNYETGEFVALTEFKDHRADLFALKQLEMLSNINEDKLKKASARDLTVAIGILHDHERLERGESTANIDLSVSGFIRSVVGEKGKMPGMEPIFECEAEEVK
jgi:hypothetical protein